MSRITIVNRSLLTAAAMATSALAFLTVSTLAHAHPMLPLAPGACSQYAFNGNFSLKQSNGATVVFSSIGPTASGNATATGGINGPLHGVVTGGIQGDNLDFSIVWNVNAPGTTATSQGRYTGFVGADGFAHGDTAEQNVPFGDAPGASAHWDSLVPLVCSTPAASEPTPAPAPAPAPPPVPVSHQPVPPAAPAPSTVPVTDAITLSFSPPGLGSITATITNSSELTAKCTYDATGITKTHRDFNVNPKGSTNLTFSGFNTGTTYHVVVSCHDASGKQPQEIGHAEQDVTF